MIAYINKMCMYNCKQLHYPLVSQCELGPGSHDIGAVPIEFMILRTGFGLLLGKQVLRIDVRSVIQIK